MGSHAGGTLTSVLATGVRRLCCLGSCLHQRIGERFEQMLQQGFLAEVEALVSRLISTRHALHASGWLSPSVAHLMGSVITPNLFKGSRRYPAVSQTTAHLVEEMA